MGGVLWYVLTGTRGGANRVRIPSAIDERPRNANRLADALGPDYTTVRRHLDVLRDNDVLERQGGDYGAVLLLAPAGERVERESGPPSRTSSPGDPARSNSPP